MTSKLILTVVMLLSISCNALADWKSDIRGTEDSDFQSPGLTVGAGLGIPYGVVGVNFNYPISQSFDFMAGLGLGAGVGFRYRPSIDNEKLRFTFMYGTNVAIDDLSRDELETFPGFNIGLGVGSRSGGWDLDLIYMFISDEAKDRVTELESQGSAVDGSTDNQIKLSFGYHW